jgi:hypothetical protein
MKDEDERWLELACYTQKNRTEYEDDPVVYTKSTYYSPKEI